MAHKSLLPRVAWQPGRAFQNFLRVKEGLSSLPPLEVKLLASTRYLPREICSVPVCHTPLYPAVAMPSFLVSSLPSAHHLRDLTLPCVLMHLRGPSITLYFDAL